MKLEQTNGGEIWVFTDAECADYAYLCACMPTDRTTVPETDLINKLEAKFRMGRGGHVTPKQWNWFVVIAERYSAFILEQTTAASAIRAAAEKLSQ